MSTDPSPDTPIILVEKREAVTTVTLNRPQQRNALSLELLKRLDGVLCKIAEDASTRVVVLAANGKVFSSGHDLKEMVGRTESDYADLFQQCSVTMQRLRQIPQPAIARVHGLATAAGCQLAASCDLIVTTEDAAFATPGVRIGLFCSTPMVPLVRGLPPKIAMEMLLTGRPLSARRAFELGFVNSVETLDSIDNAIDHLAASITAASPEATELGKQAFYQQLAMAETDAYPNAVETMIRNSMQHDAQEGISAFLEKRTPNWIR